VGVGDALRVARGAARVAHGRRPVLVVDCEVHGVCARQQLLVVDDARVVGDLACAVVHDHDPLDGLEAVHARPEELHQRAVDEDDLVLGVVDDVVELLGEEPDVERVQDAPAARRREVELEVARGVPGEGAHTGVVGEAELREDAAEAPRALRPLAVRRSLDAVCGRRGDLLLGKQPLCPVEQVRKRERVLGHQALHGSPLLETAWAEAYAGEKSQG
jgi:hypothetical protein